jgi:antitoxin ParD1/3/4
MTVRLTAELERYISEKVRSGEYGSPQEAVNSLLAGIREQEALTPEDVADLRAELDPAIAEADRGKFCNFTAEDVIAEARSRQPRRRKGA